MATSRRSGSRFDSPVSTISSPAAGASIANGTSVTVTGTATDSGGGQVAGVEVSIDGGSTWHAATGTTSWSYTGIIHGNGSLAIKSRATDDSANVETPKAGVSATTACPCTMFGATVPATADSGDSAAVELGVKFTSSQNGVVSGIRFYKSGLNTGTHSGTLWTSTGTQLATGTFTNETASGWQTLTFSSPVQVTKNTVYMASYFAPSGHYSEATNFFYYRDYAAAPLGAPHNTSDGSQTNGFFANGHRFPTNIFDGSNYYVDPVFTDSASLPPGLSTTTPVDGTGAVSVATHPTATFSKDVTASSITFSVKNDAGNSAPGTTSYDAASSTVTFTPTNPLSNGTHYTASVQATDTSGKAMPAPATWSFTTAFGPNVPEHCPCTFWDDAATPQTITDPDANAIELGTKFSTDTTGVITGVRFYKGPQNTGVHSVSLWSDSGQQLATATATNESTSGWVQAAFGAPVAVTAGSSYVVSYHTTGGYYSASDGMFSSAGVDAFPLHIAVKAGMYAYGLGSYPSHVSSSNYWVEPVFTVPSSVVPAVTSSTPGSGDTGIRTGSKISLTFNTSVRTGSVQVKLTSANGTIAGTTALNSAHKVVTFTPSAALDENTSYTISVSGGTSLSGTVESAANWSFTTSGAGSCPCSLFSTADTPTVPDSGPDSASTVGVQFSSAVDGYVSGVRFYKSAANTGTHVGSLWSANGTKLAQATFSSESASGWQSVTFPAPVSITAGTTYVASYSAPNGHYADDSHFFDTAWTNNPLTAPIGAGVYTYSSGGFPNNTYQNSNYWVDPVVGVGTATDTTPPVVSTAAPLDGSSSQSAAVKPSAGSSPPISWTASSIISG